MRENEFDTSVWYFKVNVLRREQSEEKLKADTVEFDEKLLIDMKESEGTGKFSKAMDAMNLW